MDWLRRLGQNRLLDVGVVIIGVLGLIRLAGVLPIAAKGNDFAHYYLAGQVLWERGDPYAIDLGGLYERYGFVGSPALVHVTAPNPPLFLWLFVPVALLPPAWGFVLWVLVEIVALGTVLWLTCRLLKDRLSARGRLFVVMLTLAAEPVFWHFAYSQLGLLLAALILAGFAARQKGWETMACWLVTLAGLLKLFPFVLLPWFVWRGSGGWRGWLIRAGATAALILVIVVVTGPAHWLSFCDHSLSVVLEQSLNRSFNFTVPAFVTNLRLAAVDLVGSVSAIEVWVSVSAGLGLTLVLGAYGLCWRYPGSAEMEFCLLNVVMLAGSFRAWGHYYVLLIFPAAVAVAWIARRPTTASVSWCGIALVLMNIMGPVGSPFLSRHLVLKVIANYLPLYGLMLLAGILVWGLAGNRHGGMRR